MNTKQRNHPRKASWSALVGTFFAGGATIAVFALLLSSPPSTVAPAEADPPVPVSASTDPTTHPPAPGGCTVAQMVEPGEYESVERTGSASATWVVIPDSYEQIAPAPLYVLSVEGFGGASNDLDLLRPAFEPLDGVVLVTAVETTDSELAMVIAEVTSDFCVDAQRVITSMVPSLGTPPSPEPEPSEPRESTVAT